MRNRTNILKYLSATLGICLALSMTALAQNRDGKARKSAAKTATMATTALTELMEIPAKAIPESLLSKAKAIAVFPNVVKGAFIVGGSGGRGLISRKIGTEWSAPAYFSIGSGSFGFQLGASSSDIVMLFMSDDSLTSLLQDKFEIGGEAGAAAGPVGRTAKATTDAQMRAKILSYSRSRGLFAGISITGAVLKPDDDVNMVLYGHKANEVLGSQHVVAIDSIPSEAKNFHGAVTKYGK